MRANIYKLLLLSSSFRISLKTLLWLEVVHGLVKLFDQSLLRVDALLRLLRKNQISVERMQL